MCQDADPTPRITRERFLRPVWRSLTAYDASNNKNLHECGLVQLASRTVGVAFVSVTAASLAIADLWHLSHLFLGYNVREWSLRSLLYQIWDDHNPPFISWAEG